MLNSLWYNTDSHPMIRKPSRLTDIGGVVFANRWSARS
jgi:hypothetical protein